LTLFLSSQTVQAVLGLCTYHSNITKIDPETYFEITEVLSRVSLVIHIAVSLSLLFMFTSRLLRLFMLSASNNIRDSLSMNPGLDAFDHTQFTEHQRAILEVVIKNTILSCTAIVSSQIFFNYSLRMISTFHHLQLHVARYQREAPRYFIMLAVDCFINILCTFLSFKTEERWYWRLCSWSHRLCHCLCSKFVACKVKHEAARIHRIMTAESQTGRREPGAMSYDSYSRQIAGEHTITGTPGSHSIGSALVSTRGVSRDLTTSLYE